MGKMSDKVVIITGGGKGIGFGIATAYAKEGADIVITGRTTSTLEKAKASLEKDFNVNVLAITAEGSNESEVQNVIDKTIEKFSKIDIIVNNAQASKSGVLLVDHSKEDFDLAINSGLYSTFTYMKLAFPYLKKV